jgi:tRNA modification GTPase
MGLSAKQMNKQNKTIYALSTPSGKSALAIIRISGPLSHKCIKKISKNMPLETNRATYNELVSFEGELIDQTITTFYKSPKSFTGEDMVEISTHGSKAVLKKIFSLLSNNVETRIATPGEFTRRAFENNKLDLTQVEATADIVNAETEMQRKQALNHLSGSFFLSSKKMFEDLKKILANIEAFIDFSEEELPDTLMLNIKEQIENNIQEIRKILKNSSIGISIREGFDIAILGKPNTGKSSFINNVSSREVAIVTDLPGTTRDLIESFVDIDGYPIKFIDTAGIRETEDFVEKIGVKKAFSLSEKSDINIVFIEKKSDILDFDKIKNVIFVKSKQDITKKPFKDSGYYNISNKNKYGIKNILEIIKKKIENNPGKEDFYISRERHVRCLSLVLENLENSQQNKNIDLFAEDVRLSIKNFSNLFGKVDIEDILDIIFSDFCIGK